MSGRHVAFLDGSGAPFEEEVDYVVVGSGAGGASAAVVLARGGAKVAIVEAGAWRDPDDYPLSAYGAMRDLMDDWGSQVTMGRALWPLVQARTMGGTTVINSAICVRTPDDIFVQWEKERGISGLRARVLAHQARLEDELSVEEVPPIALGQSNRLAKKGADALSWDSHYMRRYVKGCEGTGQCLQGCKKSKKQSTNLNYVPETMRRGGVILSCAPVSRVELEGTRAVGVSGRFVHPTTRAKGRRFVVRARKAVVVAASVTHTPVLLQRSGIASRALGTLFRSHPGTGVFGCYDAPVDMNVGATQGWASTMFRETPGLKLETLAIPPELVASRLGGGGTELMKRLGEYRHIAMWCHAVRAESVGTVRAAPFSSRPVVRYTLDRPDMERFRQGMILLAKQHFAAGARAIIPGIHGMPYKLLPDQISVLDDAPLDPRRYIAILSHLFGGCPMGSDPATSVTDAQGRVHGYQGLVVADASVIPTNLGVNPQHTIMALAATFAEGLLAA
ncbi:MAG: GMC family oxidoreductase [Myxococcota bacterium]|nr:GMC family oxidoreductase [Myxococcota bacterium]